MFDHRSFNARIAAEQRTPFVPDMPQDNYPTPVEATITIGSALLARGNKSQRDLVRDSLNRKGDK